MKQGVFFGATAMLLLPCSEFRGQEECSTAPLNLIFQELPVEEPKHQSEVLFLHAVDAVRIEVPPGESGEKVLHGALVSQLGDSGGVQGWSIKCMVRADEEVMEFSDVTVEGTAASVLPEGLFEGGFQKTQLFYSNSSEQSGFVSAVILSFAAPVPLRPRGTATIISFTVEEGSPQ